MKTKVNICSEPLKFHGEGNYNLNDIKEVKVTDDFHNLEKSVKNCQKKEPLRACTTRKYFEDIVTSCQCLPLRMWNSKVYKELSKVCNY